MLLLRHLRVSRSDDRVGESRRFIHLLFPEQHFGAGSRAPIHLRGVLFSIQEERQLSLGLGAQVVEAADNSIVFALLSLWTAK